MSSLFSLSWGQWFLFFFAWSQIVILLVTVYFHRAASHRAIELSPFAHRVARFLSWFMIAMVPREFAAVHRKHHATCDTEEDPHSPVHYGWKTVLFKGLALYRKEAANPATIEKYGKGLPVDPWEGFYSKYKNLGIILQLALLCALFGLKGALAWGILMLWIPFWAAGVINGLGHHVGYRRFATEDHSTNLVPWGLWVGGEELHNNHHAYPAAAKFSHAWYEIDLGWGAICVLRAMGLAKVRPSALPESASEPGERAFLRLMRDRHVWQRRLHDCFDADIAKELHAFKIKSWRQIAAWNDAAYRGRLRAIEKINAVRSCPRISALHEIEQDLAALWKKRLPPQAARQAMDHWIARAQAMELPALRQWCNQLSA